MQQILHQLNNNHFWLTSNRCIYWQEENAIIVSDLHFGKTGHFRKNGIAIPQNIFKEDMQRLLTCIAHFKPSKLLVVGDMFHSHANKEMDWFGKWRKDFSQIEVHLIKGNHDILKDDWYKQNDIHIHHECFMIDQFCFIHDPNDDKAPTTDKYIFSGHIHPGITLNGIGKQSLRFPCFYFGETYAVLPAFSRFTGTVSMKMQKTDEAYAIVNDAVIKM